VVAALGPSPSRGAYPEAGEERRWWRRSSKTAGLPIKVRDYAFDSARYLPHAPHRIAPAAETQAVDDMAMGECHVVRHSRPVTQIDTAVDEGTKTPKIPQLQLTRTHHGPLASLEEVDKYVAEAVRVAPGLPLSLHLTAMSYSDPAPPRATGIAQGRIRETQDTSCRSRQAAKYCPESNQRSRRLEDQGGKRRGGGGTIEADPDIQCLHS
jgi:hypothetical protein